MKRFILASLTTLFGLLAASSSASAQFAYPIQGAQRYPGWQTPLSPYLNLLRGGDPAANYFIGVVPEFQRRMDRNITYGTLQSMGNMLPPRPGIAEEDEFNAPMRSTGHPTAFGYTGGYFGAGTGVGGPMANRPANPFSQQQAGPKNKWPQNRAQPAGQKPKTP